MPVDGKCELRPIFRVFHHLEASPFGRELPLVRMECIGKIFSHVFQRCILGYKLLALCWSDGRSQFVVDFSIHGERGKVDGKEQGLTARQRERRYNRKRDRDCQTEKRKEEYFVSKLERLKSMVKRPLEDCSPIYMKAYTSSP